jgi:hypothetical protein
MMRSYTIIGTNRDELKRNIATKALSNEPLPVTAHERLDEVSARRRLADTVDFLLEIRSIHPRDGDKFIIAKLVDSDATARIDFADDAITLTVIDFNEVDPSAP